MVKVYGIKNCDTMKKAFTWLDKKKVKFEFHDYKVEGIDSKSLKSWCKQVGWETLVNKKGTTWRKLTTEIQESIKNESTAIQLMKENTSIIKRPVIVNNGEVAAVGFSEDVFTKAFSKN